MSDVIDFMPGAEVTPKRREKFCRHRHVIAVEKTRMLECDHCGATIDPFDFIWDWANERVRFRYQNRELQLQCKETQKRLDDLKRQERNIRARIKRASTA